MTLKSFPQYRNNEERVAAKPRKPWQAPTGAELAEAQARKDAHRAARAAAIEGKEARERRHAAANDALSDQERARAGQVLADAASQAEQERLEREALVAQLAGDSPARPSGGDGPTGDPQPKASAPSRVRTPKPTPPVEA